MNKKNLHILTFGCQMNVNDSFWLEREFQARGFLLTDLASASVVLLNTCAVREKPEQKVASALGRIRQVTGNKPDLLVGVLGCVAQSAGEKLFTLSQQVRLIAGPDQVAEVPSAVERLLDKTNLHLSLLDFTETYKERTDSLNAPVHPVAYVTIMQGCDNFCTYCIVPYTRGRQKSRQVREILAECQKRLEQGAKELVLLGQNVNAFGKDRHGDGTAFAELLQSVAELPGLQRLRYTSPHPAEMSNADIEAFAHLKTLCPALHLPLQSGSDVVLKRMHRKYTGADYLALVRRLREARPDLALSTDLIVGFPGESEEDFQATLNMMRQCNFISSFSFCYSDRPGAKATLFPDKILPEVQKERLWRLQALQSELTDKWLASRIGQKTQILIEGKSLKATASETSWQGRDPYGIQTHLLLPNGTDYTGQLFNVNIVDATKHSLLARQEDPS